MSTKPEVGSPDELAWLRGFEEGRNHVFQIHNEFLNGPYFQVQKEVHGLREENARMREGLFKIIDQFPENYDTRITEIARAALEKK